MCDKNNTNKNTREFSDIVDENNNAIYSCKNPLKLIINSKYYLKKISKPETALWQAVLIQALEDAFIISTKSKKRKSYKKKAIKWLKGSDEERQELQQVCNFAGVRYKYFQNLLKNLDCLQK